MKSMVKTENSWKFEYLAPPRHRMGLVFREPELRPPVYEEMVPDMTNIIHKCVAPYVDQSCMELHFEEMVSECWAKTTKMNTEGLIVRCRTRTEYFAQYKTAISNHICSLVQKHRFTEKRTGVKAPPRDQRHEIDSHTPSRPMEVRIDDPDSNCQVCEIDSGDDSVEFRELLEDLEANAHLTDAEVSVLHQLLSPNENALIFATQDAERGRAVGAPLKLRLRYEHLAKGIGLKPEWFHELHESIKTKCLNMKLNHDETDPKHAAAMATLIQFFNIQIPRSLDDVTRKRALMIAAQHQYDRLKDNPGIVHAMEICAIPIPEVRNDRFKCFGIMFQKHHRACENCGMKEGCEMQAANFGLGEITISHKLLGARHARTPIVRPTRMLMDSAVLDTEREEEILAFLDENFKQVQHQGETCYRHKDRISGSSVAQLIFSIGKHTQPLRLRFIRPSDTLKLALKLESSDKGGRPSWYLPETMSANDAINLIRNHAQATFTNA